MSGIPHTTGPTGSHIYNPTGYGPHSAYPQPTSQGAEGSGAHSLGRHTVGQRPAGYPHSQHKSTGYTILPSGGENVQSSWDHARGSIKVQPSAMEKGQTSLQRSSSPASLQRPSSSLSLQRPKYKVQKAKKNQKKLWHKPRQRMWRQKEEEWQEIHDAIEKSEEYQRDRDRYRTERDQLREEQNGLFKLLVDAINGRQGLNQHSVHMSCPTSSPDLNYLIQALLNELQQQRAHIQNQRTASNTVSRESSDVTGRAINYVLEVSQMQNSSIGQGTQDRTLVHNNMAQPSQALVAVGTPDANFGTEARPPLLLDQNPSQLRNENNALKEKIDHQYLQRESGSKAEIKNLRKNLAAAQNALSKKEVELKPAQLKIEELTTEFNMKLSRLEGDLKRQKEYYERILGEQAKGAEQQRKRLEEQIRQLEGQAVVTNASSQSQVTYLQQAVQQTGTNSKGPEMKAEIQHLKDTIAQCNQVSVTDKQKIANLEFEVDGLKNALENEKAGLENEVMKWRRKLESKEDVIKEMQRKETALTNSMKKTEKEHVDEIEQWKGKVNRQDQILQELKDHIESLKDELRERAVEIEQLKRTIKQQGDGIAQQIEGNDNSGIQHASSSDTAPERGKHEIRAVIPKSCHEDTRIQKPLQAWMSQLKEMAGTEVKVCVEEGKNIDQNDGLVFLHCLTSSSVQKDVEAAFKKAQLEYSLDVVVVVWHHKAMHVKPTRPAHVLLEHSTVLGRCVLVCDAFFWQNNMYQRDRSQNSLEEAQQILRSKGQRIISTSNTPSPSPQSGLRLVLPQSSSNDERITPVFSQLIEKLREKGLSPEVVVKDGRSITIDDGIVILPCIAASRVGSDLAACLDKACLGPKVHLVVIIFHHKAPHDCRIAVPTRDRLSDQKTVQRCLLFADAIFWTGIMYDCKVNEALMEELLPVLSRN